MERGLAIMGLQSGLGLRMSDSELRIQDSGFGLSGVGFGQDCGPQTYQQVRVLGDPRL